MTNYENEIMELLKGETPKQKHHYLCEIKKYFDKEITPEIESVLLSTVNELNQKGEKMYKEQGTSSYIERCINYDATMLIYA